MKFITWTILASILIIFTGCFTIQIRDTTNSLLQKTSGDKPPQFFMFTDQNASDDFILYHDRFNIKAPLTYLKDWQKMSGWVGSLMYSGGALALSRYSYMDIDGKKHRWIPLKYEIDISTSIMKYTEREKAIENRVNTFTPVRVLSDGTTVNINLHYETQGKENYTCYINESYNEKYGRKTKHYGCYKFNPERTMAKKVTIELIHTRVPNLPKELEPLAEEYTYEDLQKRSQRILDSLYIKDGWEK